MWAGDQKGPGKFFPGSALRKHRSVTSLGNILLKKGISFYSFPYYFQFIIKRNEKKIADKKNLSNEAESGGDKVKNTFKLESKKVVVGDLLTL